MPPHLGAADSKPHVSWAPQRGIFIVWPLAISPQGVAGKASHYRATKALRGRPLALIKREENQGHAIGQKLNGEENAQNIHA